MGLTAAQIGAGGATFTAREIAQQPALWAEVARLVGEDRPLAAFLAPLLGNPATRVVLTGAGTSAYIGECLAPALTRDGTSRIEAIATTDIVADPRTWLPRRRPTLLVSFARSGDSPESVAAVALAERLVERCAHLIVTCSEQGELCRRADTMRDTHVLLLPKVLNDQSFAMTSSFTGMLLAGAIALGALPPGEVRIRRLGELAARLLAERGACIGELADAGFERVVYLGSNELKPLAREAALKMLELTDGRVVSIADSPLGIRHGPKTILNARTLVVLFLSNDTHTRRYELDLLRELRSDAVAGRVIALSNREDLPAHRDTLVLAAGEHTGAQQSTASAPFSETRPFTGSAQFSEAQQSTRSAPFSEAQPFTEAERPSEPERFTDLELCLPYVVFAQWLAMLRSLSLGLAPDTPNAAGTVNRVVQGVTIYPYTP
jgi:tagatose-6-phosphate ketose/aldose isomerase